MWNDTPLNYHEPVFRPPGEARSLILQITLGCSHNDCAFCEMYSQKQFSLRPQEDILEDILLAAEVMPDTRRIFLADGNALVMPTDRLLEILQSIQRFFPQVTRISAYAVPADIRRKSPQELMVLRQAGLRLVYVGIESGDDELLKLVNKQETADSTVKGLLKARKFGIACSVMIVTGLGGKIYSNQHALHSAEVLNRIQPEFLSTLVLSLPFGEEHYNMKFAGEFIMMDAAELLAETELLIQHLSLKRTVFRSDHASNFLVLKGTLSRDKEHFLAQIRAARHFI
jgi:radical SAM superfamily enzyme YgiQ (UPF0313 family)